MLIPVNFKSLFTSLYIIMYNSQSLVSNTAASLEHVRLIQSLATTDHINLVCNISIESFRCSHRWVASIELGILFLWICTKLQIAILSNFIYFNHFKISLQFISMSLQNSISKLGDPSNAGAILNSLSDNYASVKMVFWASLSCMY